MKTILVRWALFSFLVLASATILGVVAVFVYARYTLGPLMGAGPSVSEFVAAFGSLVVLSGLVGLATLVGTILFWIAGWVYVPGLQHGASRGGTRAMKISLVLAPLWCGLIFFLSRLVR